MALPIEHFEDIDDPGERADRLYEELEDLEGVLEHLRTATRNLDDVANPDGVGESLRPSLEQIRRRVSEAFTTADRARQDLEARVEEIRRLWNQAADERDDYR